MGGRGSLSPSKHNIFDITSLKQVLNSNHIRLVRYGKIPNKGLSLVADACETIIGLQHKYGRHIDTIVVGAKRNSDFSFNANYQIKKKDGSIINCGRTIIIPQRTVQGGKADLNREVQYANKKRIVVAKNIQQMIYHEYGHAMHYTLKRKNPSEYNYLTKRIKNIVNSPQYKSGLSVYAHRQYNKKELSIHEHVAEATVHLLRNTSSSRHAQQIIDAVRNGYDTIGIKFKDYGKRNKPKVKITRRKKRKKNK